MSRGRWFGFIAAVLVGLITGLVYGWVIRPSGVNNTTLASLREDYKADYVLMVAETYNASGDLSQATQDLDQIFPGKPLIAVQSAIITAQQLGYAMTDLRLITQLETGLKTSVAVPGATP